MALDQVGLAAALGAGRRACRLHRRRPRHHRRQECRSRPARHEREASSSGSRNAPPISAPRSSGFRRRSPSASAREDALRQAQKMEAVGRLTGGIAHDFNNLLTPVIGGLEMIADRLEDPRLKRLAEAALESSRRGAKLTTQLLTFSRIQQIRIAPVGGQSRDRQSAADPEAHDRLGRSRSGRGWAMPPPMPCATRTSSRTRSSTSRSTPATPCRTAARSPSPPGG